jgi:hypothetical protein
MQQVAESARAEFGRWHGYSLLLNLLTVLLVTVAMALAARLPADPSLAPRASVDKQGVDSTSSASQGV